MLCARSLLACVIPLLAVLGACSGPDSMGPLMPALASEEDRCRAAASQSSPLVTEWPASEKANLEALLRSGGVAVTYAGCSMRVLPRCRVHGTYLWQRTTPSADVFEINNANELYAKLPLGAVGLEAELKRSGNLAMHTYVSGHLRLDSEVMPDVPDDAECDYATHVVGALSVGAFSLTRGGSVSGRAGVTASVGVSGSMAQSASLVRAAGDPQVCGSGTDMAPHPNCSSPLQVFLWPIPGRVAEASPPGTVTVDFVSASANRRWDVYIDDEVVCTTPCTQWVDPSRPVLLRSRENAFMGSPDRIEVLELGRHAEAGDVQFQAHGTANGKLAAGATFAALGGASVISGITFSSVGCLAGRSEGMCTGGLISLGAGALVTLGSVWLIVDALPHARIAPIFRGSFGPGQRVTVRVGPGFATGTF